MKILIVEDDRVSQRLANNILVKNNYETLLAGSVQEAIKQTVGEKICMVLLDIKLPDQEGFAFQVYLKSRRLHKSIPVVMCSSSEDEDSVIKSISHGAIGYIKKPLTSAILLPKVEEVLSKTFKTILIVDDEKMIRDLLRNTLEREGYNTAIADSGIDALKIIQSRKIDAVFSDIEMEGMTGIELLKMIRTTDNDLPIMLISGHANKYSKDDKDLVNVNGIITKPFRNFDILQAVENLFGKNVVS